MNDGLTGENTQYSRGMEIGDDRRNDTKEETIFKICTMVKLSIRIPELIFLCKQ